MPIAHGREALDPGARAHELWSRALVTFAALIIFRAGCHVPIPGVDGAALASLFSGAANSAVERLSIFSLGLMPLLSVLILVELAKLVFPGFRRWGSANELLANRMFCAAALGVAGLQGAGIALALEDVPHLVGEPGFEFRAGTVATLVAGTAFLIWLADAVTRHGLGGGFWMLLAAPVVADLPAKAAGLLYLVNNGTLAADAVLAIGAFFALGTAALVALAKANGGAEFQEGSVGPWPPVLAYASLGWLIALFYVLAPPNAHDAVVAVLSPGRPLAVLLLALLGALFALLYASPERPEVSGGKGVVYAAAIAIAGLLLVSELISTYFSLPFILDVRWLVVLVVVMLVIRDTISRATRPLGAAGSPE